MQSAVASGPGRLAEVIASAQHPEFFFVNIGANDGVSNDPIFPFLEQYRWRGIAVEPVEHICAELRQNLARFDGIIVEQVAIAAASRPFFYVRPDGAPPSFCRQIGSFHREYVEKSIALMRMFRFHGPVPDGVEEGIDARLVPCLTFEELMAKHEVRRVDFLNIDAESADFEVFGLVDLERWQPTVLCIETSEFTPAEDSAVQQRLARHGYAFLEHFDVFSKVYFRG
jgi:FkbM family methyltransferase